MGDEQLLARRLGAAREDLRLGKEQTNRVAIQSMWAYGRWLARTPHAAAALLNSPPVLVPDETGSESQRVAHRRLFTLAAVVKYTPGLRVQQAWLRAMGELCGVQGPGGRRWFALILRQLLPAAASSPSAVWPAKTRQLLNTLRRLFKADGGDDADFEAAMADTFLRVREQAALCVDAAARLRLLDWLLLERPTVAVPPVAFLPVAPAVSC